jgi:serine/threonine protein kinase
LIDRFRRGKIGLTEEHIIGTGGRASVTVDTDRKTGKTIAVKHLPAGDSSRLVLEVKTMIRLNHPCVIRICGWWNDAKSGLGEIHMEFAANGNLDGLIERARRGEATILGNPTQTGKLICLIVLGMRYVHSKGLVHRDLKPLNILLDETWSPKICDFGLSCRESVNHPVTGIEGTAMYSAPEQLRVNAPHTTKSDLFSFGHVLFGLMTGKTAFHPILKASDILKRITARRLPAVPKTAGTLMQGLIQRCWSVDPGDRPSFDEIFREFEVRNFAIMPGVDQEAIRRSTNEIIRRETQIRITGR